MRDDLVDDLAALRDAGLERVLRCVEPLDGARLRVDGRDVVSFASCDYLALARHPRLVEAAAEAAHAYGTSTGSARLLVGNDDRVAALERELAAFFGAPSALVFGSGYHANVGVVTALAGRGDLVVSDRLSHASTVDACRLSGADVHVAAHDDVDDVVDALRRGADRRRRLVLVEGTYSMDGDVASLPALAAACAEHDALLVVDDAHGLGCVGPGGRGACAAAGVTPDVQVGNLGKALGSYGGFALVSDTVREWLLQTARTFVFTCALPPSVVAAARAALAVLCDEPGRVARLHAAVDALHAGLSRAGLEVPRARADGVPIVPFVVGDTERALALSSALLERGRLVPAVRPPTVPDGSSRLRITLSSAHTSDDVEGLAADLAELARDL